VVESKKNLILYEMPYKISKVPGGFLVKHGRKAFSNRPLPLKTAQAQRIAIIISEKNRKKK
jgi:hypothetical protein